MHAYRSSSGSSFGKLISPSSTLPLLLPEPLSSVLARPTDPRGKPVSGDGGGPCLPGVTEGAGEPGSVSSKLVGLSASPGCARALLTVCCIAGVAGLDSEWARSRAPALNSNINIIINCYLSYIYRQGECNVSLAKECTRK